MTNTTGTQAQSSRVGELIHGPSVTLHGTATLAEAAAVLSQNDIGAAGVLDAHGLTGIISERDVVRALVDGVDLESERVEDVMALSPTTVNEEHTIVEAAELMLSDGIRHLPVTADGGVLVGVVSIRDVVGPLIDRL